ncbi:hypothetical protein [Pseudonocardia sp. DLS-67]
MSRSDPVPSAFSPDVGTEVVFENDRVRVWAMTLGAGETCEFHQHHFDHLVLWPEPGRSQGQEYGATGWPITQEAERGFAFFRTVGRDGPLPPHRMRNLEDHPVTHYIVELISEESPSAGSLPHQTNGRGRTSRPTA